jgi:hypothetical protein
MTAKEAHIPTACAAKAEVIPDNEGPGTEALQQDLREEPLRRVLGEGPGEALDDDLIDAGIAEETDLLGPRHDARAPELWREEDPGRRLKGVDTGRRTQVIGVLPQALQQVLVPSVDAIKVPDGYDRLWIFGWILCAPSEDLRLRHGASWRER